MEAGTTAVGGFGGRVVSGIKNGIKSFASRIRNGGKTFPQYKSANGGGGPVAEIELINRHPYYGDSFPIRIEYSHRWITQFMQRRFNLPNGLVNNRLNVVKTNTLRHAGHDRFRFRFLPREIKNRLGPGGDLDFNMFD